jgi:hypothetical protein
MDSIFTNISSITTGLSNAQNLRSKYDSIRMNTTTDQDQREYYKKRVLCNNRASIMKLKYILAFLILPMIFLILNLTYDLLPGTLSLVPFGLVGLGIMSLIIMFNTKFAKLDYRLLNSEITSKEDCDKVFA